MMRKIESMDEIHEILLNIMLSFDAFCKKNGINYSIAAGTMLGAVRHKGFIPWDDDIDIFMIRKDYDIFCELARECEYYIDEYYKVRIPNETKDYYRAFVQIEDTRTFLPAKDNLKKKYNVGIHIDIFPLDYGYDDYSKNIAYFMQRRRLFKRVYRACGISHNNRIVSLFKKIYNAFFSILGMNEEYWIDKHCQLLMLPKAKYVGNFACNIIEELFLTEKVEDGYTTLEFEGHMFPSYIDYDYFLRTEYGEYMKLPPLEERKPEYEEAYYL